MCRAEFLNHLRVREWQDCTASCGWSPVLLGIRANTQPAEPEAVHRAVLAGLLSHIGLRDSERREYPGARNSRFAIAPGSALFKKPPAWVVVAELVETTRLWGRVGPASSSRWVEELAGHLVKRSYGEPWWDTDRGAAMVSERVTLYGVPVVAARTVPFARVDLADARSMFVWHALVEGEWETFHDFVGRRAGVAEVQALEDKARRRDTPGRRGRPLPVVRRADPGRRHVGPPSTGGGGTSGGATSCSTSPSRTCSIPVAAPCTPTTSRTSGARATWCWP